MYFIIKTYVKEQKPHELINLCSKHMAGALKTTKEPKILAQEALTMAKRFDNVAHLLYASKPHMQFLEYLFSPFCACCFWQDVHQIKEFFLLAMIDELKNCVKTHPTTPIAHQDLALGYLTLFSHYNEPLEPSKRKLAGLEAVRQVLEKKRAFAADFVIEECLILREYTPDDPWVYKHLAPIYHDLQRYDKEIEAYEALVSLQPDDFEALYTLGMLYFAQGMNAKGLKVYEQMQLHDPKQAQKLITMYGAYLPYDPYRML